MINVFVSSLRQLFSCLLLIDKLPHFFIALFFQLFSRFECGPFFFPDRQIITHRVLVEQLYRIPLNYFAGAQISRNF